MIFTYSQIESYLLCGEAYRRTYIEGEREATCRMHIGSSVARVSRRDSMEKLAGARCLSLKESVDIGVEAFEQLVESRPVSDPENIANGSNHAAGASRAFHTRVSPVLKDVTHAEERWGAEIELPDGLGKVVFEGTPDTVLEGAISDQKTGRRWRPEEARKNRQLPLYSLLFFAKYGLWPRALYIDNIFRVKGSKYDAQRLEAPNSAKAVNACVQLLATVKRGIDAGVFAPPGIGSRKCSQKQCGYYNSCVYIGD